MNQYLEFVIRYTILETAQNLISTRDLLDHYIFQGWLKKSYSTFLILGLLYTSTYEIINNKYNIKPNYTPSFMDITSAFINSGLPILNIISLCTYIGEDIKLIVERSKHGRDNKFSN